MKMNYMHNTLALFAISILVSAQSYGLNIYEDQYGHNIDLYGEIGNGAHFDADNQYQEFNSNESFIDDSFAALGIKGTYDTFYYKLEMDYGRENWQGGSGDMVLSIDKSYFGIKMTDNHALEFGLTDTAFDDYDSYGDFTFDTTVETGDAGDQDSTIKYEGQLGYLKFGSSFSYKGQSNSGSELGNITNGYFGFFSDVFSMVLGAESRVGSEGVSKYGKQQLAGAGIQLHITDSLAFGVNGYLEEEFLAVDEQTNNEETIIGEEKVYVYNQYQKLERKGWLVSSKFKFNEKWEVTASHNFEEHEEWDEFTPGFGNETKYTWGKERIWQTLGINFKPYPFVVMAAEASAGEADQTLYAYTRIYF